MLKKIIFAVLLALVLILVLNKTNNTTHKSNSKVSTSSSGVPAPREVFSLVLTPQNGSNHNGIATVEGENNKTKINIRFAEQIIGSLPVGIFEGSCQKPLKLKYSLDNIDSEGSETLLPVSLKTLKADAPLVIGSSGSKEDRMPLTSCGQLFEK